MLNEHDLLKVIRVLCFTPELDLFASRLNNQLSAVASYRPDPYNFECFYIGLGENLILWFPPIFENSKSSTIIIPLENKRYSSCSTLAKTRIVHLVPTNGNL